jgi:hypothetical protein
MIDATETRTNTTNTTNMNSTHENKTATSGAQS